LLDEPRTSTSLRAATVDCWARVIERERLRGATIVFISHACARSAPSATGHGAAHGRHIVTGKVSDHSDAEIIA